TAGVQRGAAAAICLGVLATAACAKDQPAAEARHRLQLIVHDCGSGLAAQVFIDGQPLALIPPAQRDDSVEICYNGVREVGARVQVRVRARGVEGQVELRPNAQSRYLLITPGHAPYASLAHDPPMLD